MEPFGILGVAASIITCVQLTGALLKRVGVGPSDHSKKDLNGILKAVCGFSGAYEGLKTTLLLNEEDETRLSALQHLEEPLRDCKSILDLLEKRLKSPNFIGQYMVGSFWDAKLKRGLKRLQDAKTLFEIALDADQHIILSAVERYVRNVAEDVRELVTHVNENGKRLRDLHEHSREQSERVNAWHGETETAIHVIGDNVLAHDSVAKKRHQKTEAGLHRIGHDVNNHRRESESEANKREKDEIVRWLSCTDPTINQNAAREIHEPQTGKWFICGKEYSRWKEMPQSFLWIHGIAGCGKTILSSTIVQDLIDYCKIHRYSLAYFYCSFTDIGKQNPHNVNSSLLAQLVRNLPSIPNTLSQLHGQYQNGKLPMDVMKVELRSVLKLSGQTFLVIDALDECPIDDEEESRTKVLAMLTELSEWALPNLHVLVTSRKEPDIDEALAPLANLSSISIQTNQVQPDIYMYIKSQLANDVRLKKWSPLIKEEIENTLLEQAHGMFRWVFCQIDSLKKCIRPRDVQNALKSLPKSLDDYYARTLLGIDESYRQIAINALQWLAFSKRPLDVEELAEAVLIDLQATPSFDPRERLFDPHDILKILSSLVTVHTAVKATIEFETEKWKVEEVRLAHFSVKEYLVSNRPKPAELSHFHITEITADQLIAESSLLYMKSLAETEDRVWSSVDNLKFPLLRYVCRFWSEHVSRVHFERSKAFADLIVETFASKSKSLAQLVIYNSHSPAVGRWTFSYHLVPSSLFVYACFLGFDQTVQQLLELGKDNHVYSEDCHRALLVSVGRGYENIVDILLKAGANFNVRSERGKTLLEVATANGHEAVVNRLLKAKVDGIVKPEWSHGIALDLALRRGHQKIAQRLLQAGKYRISHLCISRGFGIEDQHREARYLMADDEIMP